MAESYSDITDQILQGCVKRESKSQELLYKKYFGYALSVSLLYCKSRGDAVEVVNDSFLKVFAVIESFRQEGSFKSWLRRIVINTALDKIRKERRNISAEESINSSLPDLTGDVISHLEARSIASLIDFLPFLHRTVFCLFELEGYSHDEISKKLKIPASSSRAYLSRAKRQLRELYLKSTKSPTNLHFNNPDE